LELTAAIGLVRGAYHFAHPGNDASAEADIFPSTVHRVHTEYTDRHGVHGADDSSVIVDAPCWIVGDALVRVSGLRPDDPVDIMWTRMTRGGTAVKDDAWRATYRAEPTGGLTVSHGDRR
jgi:hypothetical protein